MRRIVRKCVPTLLVCLFVCLTGIPTASAQDPGTPGPLATTREEYNYGDSAATLPSGWPGAVEFRGSVTYPTALAGPYPLVVLLHGRHGTCSSTFTWPCPAGQTVIPSFQGYDYFSDILASHGYIVVSISANGINARDGSTADAGAQGRAELVQLHLNQWNTFNTTGAAPFGTKFVGKVNLNNVGTMGHSRGGEGVARHFVYNQSLGSPYQIKAVLPLAPTDFSRNVNNNVPIDVILPYCDGDVSDLQGVHFYDDARYAVPGDTAPKHYLLVMGANHNFFNTVWTPGFGFPGASDDWGIGADPQCGVGTPRRLSSAQQRGVGLAYMSGFFRLYLGGETAFAPMLKGDVAPPPSAMTTDLFPSYQPPDTALERRDVNRLLIASHLSTNQLGGAVAQSGITPYDLCGGEVPQPQHCLTGSTTRQPHTVPSPFSSKRGLSQLRGGWSGVSTFTNDLPAGFRNVSGFKALQFRASVNFQDARNPAGVPQNFKVRLTDGTGAFQDALVNNFSNALYYPPGSTSSAPLPKVVLNTIRVPLSAFPGVNLGDVRSVQFRFDQTASGALLISDLAFADSVGGGGPISITVQTNPAGLQITVDGVTLTAPQNFMWSPGSSHTIATTSPQTGGGSKNVFASWSDGGAISHIVAPAVSTAYTANFTTQYLLTTAVSPSGSGNIGRTPPSVDGYYDSGTSVQLAAFPNFGFGFSSWTGDATGSLNPVSVVMSAPRNVTANFNIVSVSGLRFVPVSPCRVADTRNAPGPLGGPVMTGGSTRNFPIPSSSCGIPATALAYSLNTTVVPTAGTLLFLSIWPAGQPQPLVSSLNSLDGRIKANATIVPAGSGGSVSVFVTNDSHVILDINGYFALPADAPSGLVFYPVTPCRVMDSRLPVAPLGGPILSGGASRTVPVLSSSCGIPGTAAAYSLNMTVVPTGALGFLTTWPTGTPQPLVSTLNDPTGTIVANAAIVPAGTGGSINVFVTDQTHVIIDVNGYFAAPGAGGLLFYATTPCRMVDTRNPPGPFGGPSLVGQRDFSIAPGPCGAPATTKAYSLNATVVPAGSLLFLTLWPAGQPQPVVSTLNAPDGSIVSNGAIVPTTSGPISAFSSSTTDLILDLNGIFAP